MSNFESIATGLVKPKTTAIFFDKLWVPFVECFTQYPSEVLFTGIKKEDQTWFSEDYWIGLYRNAAYSISQWIKMEKDIFNEFVTGKDMSQHTCSSVGRNAALLSIADRIREQYSLNITPIYTNKTIFEECLPYLNYLTNKDTSRLNQRYCDKIITINEYFEEQKKLQSQKSNAIEVCIKNIPEIIEEELDWKQVLDIRKDKKTSQSIRRLKRWLRTDFVDMPESEIIDRLEQTIDDYSFSLKKHGVMTIIGSISTILTSTASILDALSKNPIEYTATGFVIAAGIFAFTSQQVAEYMEKKREPIAFLYSLKKKV